ncbi:hypothetical protein F53441_4474 [Fusarium austroafricanum]|uniref:Uncharacterized protein n=1 Tax=Fusarium austroafricanum TaxID=2364996 RepID=A0A8H4P9F5_9HYPO|nr:hypothetical protein F53441_4474 [Fusarium austroafricanum]
MAPGTLYSTENQSKEGLQRVWHALLQEYMSRSLTFESDRLVAFAGIADLFQSHTQISPNSYLAGIWRHTLLQDLLWTISDGRKVSTPQKYRAPSWSWASVEPAPGVETIGSEFGSVSGGCITLQGPLIKACVSMKMIDLSDRLTKEQAVEFVSGGRLRYVENHVSIPGFDEVPAMGNYTENMSTKAQLDDLFPTVLVEQDIGVYLAVFYRRFNHDGSPIAHALVLVRGIEKAEFRRIGYVTMTRETIEPAAKDRDFGVYAALTDEGDYLSVGDRPGIYNYRIV